MPAMRMPATWQQYRARWIASAVGVLVLVVLAGLAIHINTLLQPQRFTGLLERNLAAAGIKLELQAPASPQLLPRPGVKLQGFSLTNMGARTPILQADSATIVVPWRTLWRGDVAIERVEIDAPQIDLGELEALLMRLPHHRGPPQLPTIVTGVHLRQGTLASRGTPLLFEVGIDTGELVPGRPFRLNLSARDANGNPLHADLDTVPSVPHDDTIDFDSTRIGIRRHGGLALQLAGQGRWRGGEDLALQLSGSLQHQPFNPPAASTSAAPASSSAEVANAAPRTTANIVDHIQLTITPARGHTPLAVTVQLAGTDAHADFTLHPTAFGAWWQRVLAASPEHPPGALPFTGQASAQHIDLGDFKATGLRIDADADLAPASAATAPTPSAQR